ncbi:MAG TPA: ATP-binding protein [Blastocatellia bacterium]|nr:ATP-binding protein [Blastocatellia bacterium]
MSQPEQSLAHLSELMTALRRVKIFADLPPEHLAWLATHGQELRLAAGEALKREGDPADAMFVFFEGEMQARREGGGFDGQVYTMRAGDIGGVIPFSRMTRYGVTSRAVAPVWGLRLGTEFFPEMLERMPALTPRFVAALSDRVRETTREDSQRDKLTALGKLSAGLAHELNNPAAASRRAAQQLRQSLRLLSRLCVDLNEAEATEEQYERLAEFQREAAAGAVTASPLDALAASEREDEVAAWLGEHQVEDGWELAPTFVRAGIDPEKLGALAADFPAAGLGGALRWLEATLAADELVGVIEQSTGRISELVRAIKEYSYMDQAPVQEVDVHQGLESTLVILGHKLKQGVTVTREYDESLPRISAYGSELNQVWTNLIVNAVEAMGGEGQLWVRTRRKPDHILVEIADDGPGIPPEIQGRIFEPFFTTKPVGEGTGLGLDTVYRIVRKHHGDVRVTSKPGATCFQVRLPMTQPGEKS